MADWLYYAICAVLSVGVLVGISWMSKVDTARKGNKLSALCMLAAVLLTLWRTGFFQPWLIISGLVTGAFIGIRLTEKTKIIAMPQLVALLNGLGGLASALAAVLTLLWGNIHLFERTTAAIALMVGAVTFSGSLVAAAKLAALMPQKPWVLKGHSIITAVCGGLTLLAVLLVIILPKSAVTLSILIAMGALAFGIFFAVRVGGADMPITISLLNSTSGVAAAIAGMAVGDVLLVSVGGIVGASGLLLTQIMCRAMNRSLKGILLSQTPVVKPAAEDAAVTDEGTEETAAEEVVEVVAPATVDDLPQWIKDAKEVIIVPGYGMALSQAQGKVKALYDKLLEQGKTVRFAIHPVAGRMPGHMNVLLAEVDVPYDALFEMDDINPDFDKTDLVIVIGANDVMNPAANTEVGTPIYGMPVLSVDKAKNLVICNFDDKPGYAGVPNPLYQPKPNVLLLWGDAKDSLNTILGA